MSYGDQRTGPWTLPKPTNLVSKPPILIKSLCGRFSHESYRRAYLSALGWDNLDPNGQPSYKYNVQGDLYVVPAQLLIFGLIASEYKIRQSILRPCSPHSFLRLRNDENKLTTEPAPLQFLSRGFSACNIVPRFEWFLAYPSAFAAWTSIYRFALNGTFDLQMPHADAQLTMCGVKKGDYFFVTRIAVMSVFVLEKPFEYAKGLACSEYIFYTKSKNALSLAKEKLLAKDVRISNCNLTKGLTDEQWTKIESLFLGSFQRRRINNKSNSPKYAPRDIINAIILKLGTPYPWWQLPVSVGLRYAAMKKYASLESAGAWQNIINTLLECS